jgi:hypothetical protein
VSTNNKPLGPIIMMGQSETLSSSSQIIFITPFSASGQRCCQNNTTNSEPAGPIIMIDQSEKTDDQVDHIYYTLFRARAQRCCAIYQPQQTLQLR